VSNFKETVAVWKGGLEFEATGRSGFPVRLDGDGASAADPMELILMGLAGCTGGDVVTILQKKRQQVAALEVRVHGKRAHQHPRCYREIELTFVVTGHRLDPEAVRRAIELSETKYCSVSASLKAFLTTRYEIRETEIIPA
jgi:putative redox protein